jgi:hypothetical protein
MESTTPIRTTHNRHTFLKGLGAAILSGGLMYAAHQWGMGLVVSGAGIGFVMFAVGYTFGVTDGEQLGKGKVDSQDE